MSVTHLRWIAVVTYRWESGPIGLSAGAHAKSGQIS